MKPLIRFTKHIVWRLAPGFYERIVKSKPPQRFSIALFVGDDIANLRPSPHVSCPVLTFKDVTDLPASFVADPFMVHSGGRWHMFFEAMDEIVGLGRVCHATSTNLRDWSYQGIVLKERFHLAYPYVFSYMNEFYMIPDSPGNGIRLYKATDFPRKWSLVVQVREDNEYSDSSIFWDSNSWWLFTAWAPDKCTPKCLRLFYSDSLMSGWQEHPKSPVVKTDGKSVRPAGSVRRLRDGRLIRFAQEGKNFYGECVRAVEIEKLDRSSYTEMNGQHPILQAGAESWRTGGMHHIDAHYVDDQLVCCVDGWCAYD